MSYIKKEPIIEFITKGLNNPDKTEAFGYDAIAILTEIEFAPTADVVEVVQCRDCKHCVKSKDWASQDYFDCTYNGLDTSVLADHYCSYGERREE